MFFFVALLVFLQSSPDFIQASPLSLSKDLAQQGLEDFSHSVVVVEPAFEETLNPRPIVGILAQELSYSLMEIFANKTSYIGAAYVKYIEAAGARVVPVLINQDDEYYDMIFKSTNGLLIPGGAVSLTTSGYAKAGQKLFDMAMKAWDEGSDPYPIWGTCLGFELLTLFANQGQANLASCYSVDQALALNLTEQFEESNIGAAMPAETVDIVSNKEVTINFHHWCLTPQNFSAFHMENFWKMLATGKDINQLEFVALIEANDYPFWASQFHPEKNAFEWTQKWNNIPHSKEAIETATFFAEYFVEKTRKNHNNFETRNAEEQYLIYNFSPIYTGRQAIDSTMEQSYIF